MKDARAETAPVPLVTAPRFPAVVADVTDQLFPEFLCLFGEIESLRGSRPHLPAGATEEKPENDMTGVELAARSVLRRRAGIPVAST